MVEYLPADLDLTPIDGLPWSRWPLDRKAWANCLHGLEGADLLDVGEGGRGRRCHLDDAQPSVAFGWLTRASSGRASSTRSPSTGRTMTDDNTDAETSTRKTGNVRTNMSMSLDGFITGPNESVEQPFGEGGAILHDWMCDGETEFSGEVNSSHDGHFNLTGNNHEVLRGWFETTGALVVGRRWFDGMEGWDGTHPIPGVPVFVLTHEPPEEVPTGETTFEFVTGGVESAVERASEAAGEEYVGVGGASVIQQCITAGLLDEIQIHLVPVLLGDGVRMFDHFGTEQIELESTRVIESPSVTHLQFRVVNEEEK